MSRSGRGERGPHRQCRRRSARRVGWGGGGGREGGVVACNFCTRCKSSLGETDVCWRVQEGRKGGGGERKRERETGVIQRVGWCGRGKGDGGGVGKEEVRWGKALIGSSIAGGDGEVAGRLHGAGSTLLLGRRNVKRGWRRWPVRGMPEVTLQ